MDERSFDDTEPTPEPTPYRPPPRSQHPLPPTPSRGNNDSMLERTLFSFSVGGTSTLGGDGADESLPSLSGPPSPLSRPSGSLFGDDYSKIVPSSSKQPFVTRQHPPIAEVRLETSRHTGENDTFFECFEDRSLARRTQRSLTHTTPEVNKKSRSTATASDASVQQPSIVSSVGGQRTSTTTTTDAEQHPSSEDVTRVHGNALHALMRLKEELIKANEKNQALQHTNQQMAAQRQEQESTFQANVQELRRAVSSLQETNSTLESQNDELTREKGEWAHQKKDLEVKLRTAAREKKESMHRKLAADNRHKELRSQLDQVKVKLDEALSAKEELASDLALAQSDKVKLEKENADLALQLKETRAADGTMQELQMESESKNQDIGRLTTALNEFHQKHQQVTERLEVELKTIAQKRQEDHDFHQNEIERLKATLKARSSLRGPASPARRTPTTTSIPGSSNVRFQAEGSPLVASPGATLENSIADRLARMRDSAERAHLIKAHKREMARVKLDKEAETKKLASAHEDAMRKAKKQTDSTLNSKLEELKKTLKEEYEEKLEEAESRHKEKFSEVSEHVF
jgi:hypothetical protein